MRIFPVVVAAVAMAQVSVVKAEGWEFMPMGGENFRAEPTLSVLAGQLSPQESGVDSGTVLGVEFAMNCVLLAAPGGTLRQQISYAVYDEDDVEISTIEINPHYMIDVAENVRVGFGPGVGYVMADTPVGSDNVFAFQFGGSAQYRMGALSLGAEVRWQWTQSAEIAGVDIDLDNSRFVAKVGYNF